MVSWTCREVIWIWIEQLVLIFFITKKTLCDFFVIKCKNVSFSVILLNFW